MACLLSQTVFGRAIFSCDCFIDCFGCFIDVLIALVIVLGIVGIVDFDT